MMYTEKPSWMTQSEYDRQKAIEALPIGDYTILQVSPRTYHVIHVGGRSSHSGDDKFWYRHVHCVTDKPIKWADAIKLCKRMNEELP